jgi:DNA repair exonuclease SbcCD ATPase subunit
MIIFEEVRWGNAFSYGPNNKIRLDGTPLTQIVGKNGHGKSSIALIIEEVLFNQNSKKIKKSDILNRYSKEKNYTIELDFNKDGTKYNVAVSRTGTASNIKLISNGTDISSHTATGTYKTLEGILGFDHKTFSQIVYQSSVSSLEFLTATDTARKKFLIELLNLTVYTRAADVFKELTSGMTKQVDSAQTKINTVRSWLTKYEKEDLTIRELADEPASPTDAVNELALINNELSNIESTNKKIATNNKYRELLETILAKSVWTPTEQANSEEWLMDKKVRLAALQGTLKNGKTLAAKCDGPTSKCPTCTQTIDNSTMYHMVEEFEASKAGLLAEIDEITKIITTETKLKADWATYNNTLLEIEKYHALIDKNLTGELLDKNALTSKIIGLEKAISTINSTITKIRTSNKAITEHNSKVSVISAQMQDMKKELETHSADLLDKANQLSNLQVLVKAFSTTGLVAYKIECLVKDLEELTNEYLNELADGRFQLSFKIASSDKLNVVITDNSHDVDMLALSSGERARVNVATLLAIRKLMQTLSNSRTNLLILDETVENLDNEGKERLIEVLLKEENLNTFLISHGFSHPLLEKLQVVKEKNISRIET